MVDTYPTSVRAALAARLVLENDGHPIGYQPPSKFNTASWAICVVALSLVFGWIALGAIQAPIPDYLVHPLFDTFIEPLAHSAAWVFGW